MIFPFMVSGLEAYLYAFSGQKNRTKPDVYFVGPDREKYEDDTGN